MKYLSELIQVNGTAGNLFPFKGAPDISKAKNKVNILALGDVGGTILMGLKLLGGKNIEEIGIYDLNPKLLIRYEYEMNQTNYPFNYDHFPKVRIIEEKNLFDCNVFIFCASKSTPVISTGVGDIRMSQYKTNKPIVEHYAAMAGSRGFKGLFAVVSDPVDPLCKVALLNSELKPWQIQGFGLGVMNSRAAYFAKDNEKFRSFLTEGRSFGPHGQDLVIANSIIDYDDAISLELTKLTVESNLKMREIGFKPYIAPALSSGVLSILLTLKGEWHYSSNYLECDGKGAFLGSKNRMVHNKIELENLLLQTLLFDRINTAYKNLINL